MAEERLGIKKIKQANGQMFATKAYAVNRVMTAMYTKSTLPYDPNSGDYESKWILSLRDNGKQQIGLILFDISTLQFNIG